MAFSAGGSNGGFRGRRRFGGGGGAISEINVVPLVDVVLVLLIIFMLTAHVMDYGLKVDVPKTRITEQSSEDLPVIIIRSDQTLYLNKQKVNIHDIASQLDKRFKGKKDVFVAVDKSIRWDVLAQVLAELKLAQVSPKMVMKPLEGKGQ
jgi:biopolymer transport protein ExbD